MALRKPIVIGANGKFQQLQAADTIASSNAGTDTLSQTNGEAGAIVVGNVVYTFAAGSVKKAQANAQGTADVLGMVMDATVAAAGTATIATRGFITATTTQWDAVTGQTGGLTLSASYFLDPTTAGKITTTPPTTAGQFVVLLGTALSTTDFMLDVEPEVLL